MVRQRLGLTYIRKLSHVVGTYDSWYCYALACLMWGSIALAWHGEAAE